ncbi:MAG: electron transport complex subunit RsxC [Zoogloeaceae bacterium]|jgi:electron transport complex protein RnfC|nr:electron transport complex subunit RsxC [Zoogloeaceae bacterium]
MPQVSFKFHGGLKLPAHKDISSGASIRPVLVTAGQRLVIPLSQSAGAPARAIVAAGDHVRKGQKIGAADGRISAAVHASTSGRVLAVEERRMPHPSGLSGLAVEIEADGEDLWIDHAPVDYRGLSLEDACLALQEAGVVGMGGAVFPSHAKVPQRHAVTTLIVNGAECEPYITCDDRLMRERAGEIVAGVRILRDLLKAETVLIGIEDNKPEAIAAMRVAVAETGEGEIACRVVSVPALYPAGSMKQLIRVLTGHEIPVGKLPTELGVQCFNVATAYSVARVFLRGEPVVRRIVTLTGGVAMPGNWEVPIGMPVDQLLALAQPVDALSGVVMGGPMMGFEVPALDVPVVKASNCLIARVPGTFPERMPEMPCIRCGACARACPQDLQPFELYWWSRARQFERAERYRIASCIECGCCAYVCPAHIPLVQYFRFAKGEIRTRDQERKMAETARERFEFKQFREMREKAEKAERLARAAAAQAQKAAVADVSGGAPENEADTRKAVIAAALERARKQARNAGSRQE